VGLEWGSLSFVRITEALLGKKLAAADYEIEIIVHYPQ
jgi:hypothetical protein